MKQRVIDISTDAGWHAFTTMRNNLVMAGKRPKGQILTEKRSLDQNAMIYALYQQVGEQAEDQSISDIRRECKLNIGIPILCAADPVFAGFTQKALGHLTYEQKLKSMEFIDVTKLMDTEQCTSYIDEVIRVYTQQGYCLLHPSEAA